MIISKNTAKNSENLPKGRLSEGVLALGWVSLLTDFSSDMIYPLLPDFLTRTLGASTAALGLIEGTAEATASVTKMASGWWSDRTQRRKPLVVAGYTVAGIVRPLVAFATSWVHVLAIRFADRVGKGIRTAPRDALLADLAPAASRGRAFGLQRAMDNAGAVVGPLVAALLLYTIVPDERTVFLLALVPGALGIALLVWKVRETPRATRDVSASNANLTAPLAASSERALRPGLPPPASRPGALTARTDNLSTPLVASSERLPRGFWVAAGIFVLFTFANSTDAFLLLRARDSGVALWQIPLLWAFFHAVKASAGVPGGALADRIGRVPCVAIGWAVYALAYAGFAWVTSAGAIWALFAGYALFFALTEGAERALIADLVGEKLRGRAYGIFHGSIGVAALPSSILFGLWWKLFGARTAFLIGAGLAAAACVALLLARTALAPRLEDGLPGESAP